MADISVFSAQNYKILLRKLLELNKEKLGMDYSFRRMADFCRVQKTYLSRAINLSNKTHLSSDQIYLACQFLKLSREEADYVLLLSEFEKCQIPNRKNDLRKKIESMRVKNLKTENNLSLKEVVLGELEISEFYLDPLLQVIHLFLTISRFAKSPDRISEHLPIPSEVLNDKIKKLESLKLIRIEDKKIVVQQSQLHLSNESSFIHAYRLQMRLSSLEQMKRISQDQYYSFSALFSATEEVKTEIHDMFLNFLKEVQRKVASAEAKDVYQMNFDLLPWSNH
jgi:uncharacterized protein (TIGR02147 family)